VECRLDPVGSGKGPVAGFCEYGDEPSGSDATDLVSFHYYYHYFCEVTKRRIYLELTQKVLVVSH
jgi:hypothetical protein